MAAFSAPSLLAAALLASAAAAPAWPPCGWPTIEENYPRPAKLQTRIAQRLLNVTPVDGVFGPSTAAAARAFQTAHGLQPDGGVGSQTWPVLAATVTPTRAGARNSGAVAAAQDALQAAGFYAGALSGNFDAATASSLAVFAAARGAVDTSGQAIDAQLWHLLVSGCNSSLATERFWIDVGWPQGSLSTSTLACLRGFFEFVVFECWLERSAWFAPCVQNIANARAGGFAAVGAYMFPVRALDPSAQAAWMVSNLTAAGAKVDLIMLDIEGDDWVSDNRTQADNRAFVTALRAGLEAAGQRVVIYCGLQWITYFGADFTAFKDLPVVFAHYDLVPSYYDFVDSPYGGWSAPAGKQIFDGQNGEVVCGTGPVDWDWSRVPFWTT